ncbi:hypothetical protein P170DRAFT_507076 [Aspergillus steynii IBT 23096]|uniref:TRP C-terminal domain-containing protein n=1 Tax=Aspergillus steynii IBT 23096 TaxID=1392250 RepID=A0A2I2GH71_9EURO|nr:uncharacterized protein P170DRAFT_507076 [Aspergillus steynii IBT 23096]PLB52229.1 hypothetical protein P170DRAFT_507076 [Aspergillus steynii IBT 23096]
MQIWSALWTPYLFLHLLSVQAAWVSKFYCASSQPTDPAEKDFRVDSLHGFFDTLDSSTRLRLSILGVHNVSQFSCSDLDLAGLGDAARLHVLGHPVGHVEHVRSDCPLPITDTLTPPEGLLFSKFEIGYSFSSNHRLQTLATEISFHSQSGDELDCAAVKITPDIGKDVSAVITYLPFAVVVLVGLASWYNRSNALETHSHTEHQSPWASQNLIWAIILDVSDYIRYLQFVFLAGSLTMEYPGFYQPVASQVAWSSLLYWSGPIDHGFTYRGVEDGMYVSNGSYGLEYMSQMLGFPQMPDIMFDTFINLFLLISGLVVVLVALYLLTFGPSQKLPFPLALRDGSYMTLGLTLSFFSLPLLSFMSYELILIGYLPNYRVILVGLGMVIIVLANYLIKRQFDSRIEMEDPSPLGDLNTEYQPSLLREALTAFSHYLPPAIPLVQGIVIGGLQDYGLVQLLLLGFCEVTFLIHAAVQRRLQIFASRNAWCAVVRLLTLCLGISFTTSLSESGRQWIGYLMLCLHGVVILAFLLLSIWEISRALRKGKFLPRLRTPQSLVLTDLEPARRSASSGSTSDINPSIDQKGSFDSFADYNRPGSSGTSSYRGFDTPISFNNYHNFTAPPTSTPTNTKHYVTDFSAFYRAPRARSGPQSLHAATGRRSTSGSFSSPADPSAHSSFESKAANRLSRNTLDEWLDVPGRSNVDYSVRESDQFYGRPKISSAVSEASSTVGLTRNSSGDISGREALQGWARQAVSRLREPKKGKKKGFEVVRPPRPGPPGGPGPV